MHMSTILFALAAVHFISDTTVVALLMITESQID
jgi:hypothetical protein